MRENKTYNWIWGRVFALLITTLAWHNGNAQEVFANQVKDSSTDFRDAYRVVDADKVNYGYVSNAVGLLNQTYLRVSFPVSGKAGDAVNFTIQGTGQLLGLGLLNNTTVRLFDSLGTQVAVSVSNSDLDLALLAGDSIYNIRYVTNPAGSFKFKEARIEFNNLLSVNLLSQFRLFGVYYQIPCPPTFANTVNAFGTNTLLSGFVTNPNNAVDNNTNNYATLTTPLNILNLLPPAYLDLEFPQQARSGEFAGFTIGQASSLLSLNLLSSLSITAYDENGVVRQVKNNFNTLDLRLLEGTVDRYVIGLTLNTGTHRISRLRIQLNSVLSLLQDLRVYNAFHYQLDRPPVPVTFSREPKLCQGESVLLTAADIPGAASYMWSNGATTKSVLISQGGVYSVTVTDSLGCTRRSLDIPVIVNPLPVPVITGDTVICEYAIGTLKTALPYVVYNWSTNSGNATIDITKGGKYYVTVADANGCVGADTVNAINNKLEVVPTITNANCNNNSATGSVSLAVTGGSNNYSYRWSNGGTTNAINNIVAGLYTVNVKDNQQGCSYNRAFTVNANNTLTVKSSVVNTSACGKSDGKVAISVVGGSGNYTYSWSNNANTQNLDNVKAGFYTVTITDGASTCGVTHTVVVSDGNSGLVVTPTITPSSSCSVPNGAISLAVAGGNGVYTYQWSNNATTASISGLAAGVYQAVVTDTATKCVAAASYDVTNSVNLGIAGNITAAGCGRSNGAITLTVTGGSNNYTYSWSDGVTTANRTNLAVGTYIVTVTDNASGCIGINTFVVGTATAPTVTLNVTQPSCGSNDAGSIVITTAGDYVYRWSNDSTSMSLTNLKPGTYTVNVTDTVTNCRATYKATLDAYKQIQLLAKPMANTACDAAADGAIDVVVTNGTSPLDFMWSNSETTEDISDLTAGTYTLNMSDANGCTATISVPVVTDSSKLLNVSVDTIEGASCATTANASLTLKVSGGVSPYKYSWSNSDTTKDLTNIIPGTYSVTVTDSLGCTAQLSVNVGVDTANMIMATVDSVTVAKCSNSQDGAIYVTTKGGAAPYTFLWSNGKTTEDITGVVSGSYTLTVTDTLGCFAQVSATIGIDTANRLIVTANSITNATCVGSATGAVDIDVTGGTLPYTYSWSNGANTQDISNVQSGAYTLTVTDKEGCTAQLGVNVGADTTNQVVVSLDSLINVGCVDSNSGAIYTTTSGGTTPYTFMWNDGSTVEDRINIPGGTYKLVATDFVGCKGELEVTVSDAALLVIDRNVKDVSCYGAKDGAIQLTVDGGRSLAYIWSNGATTNELTGLDAGTYSVMIKDNVYMCEIADTFMVNQPDSLMLTATVTNDDCFENPSGSIDLTVSGGTQPYVYDWSNFATDQDVYNLAAGSYNVTITDNNNCKLTAGYGVMKDSCSYDIVVRNVLTPNGDGMNDNWIIDGIQFYPDNTVFIFNKWGDQVFDAKAYNNTWNGTRNNGEPLADGTYYYVLKLNGANKAGGKNEYSGFLMIQR